MVLRRELLNIAEGYKIKNRSKMNMKQLTESIRASSKGEPLPKYNFKTGERVDESEPKMMEIGKSRKAKKLLKGPSRKTKGLNAWQKWVKKVSQEEGISYGQALKLNKRYHEEKNAACAEQPGKRGNAAESESKDEPAAELPTTKPGKRGNAETSEATADDGVESDE